MSKFISTPVDGERTSNLQSDEDSFGYFETIGGRFSQEDALVWAALGDEISNLSPNEIAHRLWTSYQVMNDETTGKTGHSDFRDGTTASTSVYDGKGNFITANLADAASFVIIYGRDKSVLGVKRLNSVAHKPDLPEERKRITAAGDKVIYVGCPRVNGMLAISRAIGDSPLKSVCADASLDINPIDDILSELNIAPEDVTSIDLMVCCDGFTDGAGIEYQSKAEHESYLLENLSYIKKRCNFSKLNEEERAQELATVARIFGSTDNISVAIQNIPKETFREGPPVFVGVYDGHGGASTSSYVAENISETFKSLCRLSIEDYNKHQWSVTNNSKSYARDNALPGDPESLQQPSIVPGSDLILNWLQGTGSYALSLASEGLSGAVGLCSSLLESGKTLYSQSYATGSAFFKRVDNYKEIKNEAVKKHVEESIDNPKLEALFLLIGWKIISLQETNPAKAKEMIELLQLISLGNNDTFTDNFIKLYCLAFEGPQESTEQLTMSR